MLQACKRAGRVGTIFSFYQPEISEYTFFKVILRIIYSIEINYQISNINVCYLFSQSMSGVGSMDAPASLFDSKPLTDANPPFHKERKVSQYLLETQKMRKISMSTNLPESSVFQPQNQHAAFQETAKSNSNLNDILLLNCNQDDANASKMILSQKDNLKQSTTSPTEKMAFKRSDAVDLLTNPEEKTLPEGQIQMISLSKNSEQHNETVDESEASLKSGNGSVKYSTSQATNPEQKSTDPEDHDETSHLI